MEKKDILKDYKTDFYTLLEAGFLAVNEGDEDSAIKLFKGAQILDPENNFPKVGLGYMHFCKLELKNATTIFKEVVDKDPKNEVAKVLLGISMSMMPKSTDSGENILSNVGKSTQDTEIKTLTTTALDFVKNFIKGKTKKSPVEIQTKVKK